MKMVRLCWRTEEDVKKRRLRVSPEITVDEAMEKYKKIESIAVCAYLRRCDDWHVHKILKERERKS